MFMYGIVIFILISELQQWRQQKKQCISIPQIPLEAQAFKRFLPMFDRVLVERLMPEVKTKGGIMLPEKSQGKVVEATVVAVGAGARTEEGKVLPASVKVGDKVLLPEYGGTKVQLEDKEYFLFRDGDLLGKFES